MGSKTLEQRLETLENSFGEMEMKISLIREVLVDLCEKLKELRGSEGEISKEPIKWSASWKRLDEAKLKTASLKVSDELISDAYESKPEEEIASELTDPTEKGQTRFTYRLSPLLTKGEGDLQLFINAKVPGFLLTSRGKNDADKENKAPGVHNESHADGAREELIEGGRVDLSYDPRGVVDSNPKGGKHGFHEVEVFTAYNCSKTCRYSMVKAEDVIEVGEEEKSEDGRRN